MAADWIIEIERLNLRAVTIDDDISRYRMAFAD